MERINKRRAWILLGLFVAVLCWYSWTLFKLQIIDTDGNTDNTTIYSSIIRVKAARGDILDRNGVKLVGNRASYDLVFNHYVIISSDDTNGSLLKLVNKCNDLGVAYTDHFPITRERPFEYTIDDYSDTWKNYFQKFMGEDWMDLDSDITASLLIQTLRESYKIPETYTDEEARAVIGIRYELDLRNVTNISTYIFIEDVSDEALSALLELNTPGLMVESSTVREYYTKYAAHILGYMGAMDGDDWAYYKEKGYAMDAVIGQSGFEEAFEEELHAVDGTRLDKVDKNGTIISQSWVKLRDEEGNIIGEAAPKAGNNVEVTIDIELQGIAEEELARCMEVLTDPDRVVPAGVYEGQDAEGAACVVMEVKTGDVLVLASYPTFDLATMKENFAAISEMKFDPMYNRALQGAYPPGSTFKMVTLTAAIDNHKVTPDELITDTGVFTLDSDPNFRPTCLVYSQNRITHGDINGATALEVSCNVFFYELANRLSIEQIDEVAKGFGLGEHTGVELNENTGHRSNKESKKQQYEGLSGAWFVGDRILTGIGQSENRFTPMQLCVYACTLANKGTRYKATFLNRVVSSDYRSLISENEPEILSTMEVSSQAWTTYYEGMQNVLTGSRGTGRAFFGGNRDSYGDYNGLWGLGDQVVVYGKTGTAQTFKNVSDNSAFVCFASRVGGEPEIAIALYGEKVAHPSNLMTVAEEVIRAYFSRYQTSDAVTNENRIG